MDLNFPKLLNLFHNIEKSKLLLDGTWGLERETNRITPQGELALTHHPKAFGDKLDNTSITTDFSESQLELITEPFKTVEETYQALKNLHIKVEQDLENEEILWPMSMPPKLPDEKDIPIAKFNNSEEGRKREIYRRGLALRYGKKMQMICGIHYNFSFGEKILDYLFQELGRGKSKENFINEIYFSTARNFLKYRWILIYLFGASPNFDPSYNSVIINKLKTVSEENITLKDAVSLRVSPFGYGNTIKKKYSITYNTLLEYIHDVQNLLTTRSEAFMKLGIYEGKEQIQLNDYILQSEAELYSLIRFKQSLKKGETQLEALKKRGIKYIEVRSLDINPFEKTGISLEQLYFMQVFMLYCLFENSEFMTNKILEKNNSNHDRIALYGRKEDLILHHYDGMEITLKDWSEEIFEKLQVIAGYMDRGREHKKYETVVNEEYKKIMNPSQLFSSKICDEMKAYNENYLQFGIRRAIINRNIQ